MNRRSAMKVIGAALLAPIVRLRNTIDREKLLQAFCAPEDWTRYQIGSPFGVGSLTYATDARHAVRAELSNRIEDGTRRIPDMQKAWDHYWHPGQFVPFELPAVDSPLLVPAVGNFGGTCPLCDDRRVSFGDHYPSSAEESELLKDYDPDDNTVRDSSCPLCRGDIFRGPCELVVHGVRMNYSRLKPLVALPNLRISGNLRGESTYGPLLFTADGFEGIAMGICTER